MLVLESVGNRLCFISFVNTFNVIPRAVRPLYLSSVYSIVELEVELFSMTISYDCVPHASPVEFKLPTTFQALYRRFTTPTTNQTIPEGCPACSSTKVKDYTPCLDCPKCHFVSRSFSPFCPSCDSLQPPKPNACPVDYFQLLDQPHKFNLDTTVAEQSYRKWQTRLHPDKLASVEGADTDVAAAHSALVNDAINVLRSPLRRAVHLLELHAGINVDSEGDESKPEPSVLVEMFQYNEEIDDADGDEEELERITRENNERLKACEARLVTLCDEAHDWDAVKKEVNRMKFLVRINDRLQGAPM
ncbi:hypothetical protein FOZ62_006307 [Perkinsus olseni]|uniref:Co-chaperone HscB C-terminal oligomerisation domain-containing protein n=1 Tax=Perkinsus olseni TaxID=32597 RepID=A0A7J6Q146_PEROL|nr:hypothetical protein FOZ62_006307 [Perkinsus olseni]